MTTPVLLQLPATVLHLAGLDYYNRRNLAFADRICKLRAEYWKTVLTRCVMVVPFSAGAAINTQLCRRGGD